MRLRLIGLMVPETAPCKIIYFLWVLCVPLLTLYATRTSLITEIQFMFYYVLVTYLINVVLVYNLNLS